jgi:hypothetical protein
MIRVTVVLIAAILFGACASLGKIPPAPTTAEIVQLSKDGVPAGEIIRRIDESRAVYRLSASALAQLRAQGVSDEVINYMQQTYIASVRDEEWYRARQLSVWPPYRGPFPYPYLYPYPYPYPYYYPYRYRPLPR